MRCIKHDGTPDFLHPRDGSHVSNEIIVTKCGAPFGEKIIFASRGLELGCNILHIPRRKELTFLHIHNPTGLRCRDNEIGLTAQERWNLKDVNELSSNSSLFGIVNIRRDWHPMGGTYLTQQLTSVANGSASKRFCRCAIGLVVGCLENKIDALPIADGLDFVCHSAREFRSFNHAWSENEKQITTTKNS